MNSRVCPVCGAAFLPRYGSQVCCSDKCQAARRKQQKARRRAEFFAARDAAFERAGLPIPKIEERGSVRIERRGTCAGSIY